MAEQIRQLDKAMFFRENEDVFIHISPELAEYNSLMHRHKFIEMVYVISGSAMHHINDLKYPVSKGDLVIVDYGVPHSFTFSANSGEAFVTYDLLFTPSFFGVDGDHFSALKNSHLFDSFRTSQLFDCELKLINNLSHSEFYDLFSKIYAEYENTNYGYTDIIRAHLTELILKIFRKLEKRNDRIDKDLNHQYVENAIEFLRANYSSKINIEKVVENMFLSKDYFRQLFKDVTGQSITSFIQQTRIERACNMLINTDKSVGEISVKCGYNDTKFFYQTFKKIKGVTPGDYRKAKKIP